ADSEALTKRIYGDEIGWLPWRRPGFQLALDLRAAVQARPGIKGLILAGHGMFAWGNTAKECYEASLQMVAKAAQYLNEARGDRRIFGAAKVTSPSADERRGQAANLLPRLRAAINSGAPKIGYFRDDAVV